MSAASFNRERALELLRIGTPIRWPRPPRRRYGRFQVDTHRRCLSTKKRWFWRGLSDCTGLDSQHLAIYAFADAGLVVTSDFNKGGTWAGAIEQLERLHLVPVFVCNGPESGEGSAALIDRGGIPWPEPKNSEELAAAITQAAEAQPNQPRFEQLGLKVGEDPSTYPAPSAESKKVPSELPSDKEDQSPADRLMNAVSTIVLNLLESPTQPDDLATALNVSKTQMNAWLKQMLENGQIKKLTKPVRYVRVKNRDG